MDERACAFPSARWSLNARGQDKKVYVQHRMQEFEQKIWDIVSERKGFFYICGCAHRCAAPRSSDVPL